MPIPAAERDNRLLLFESYYEAAERFREALGANGVKTDTIDSKVLSMFLLTFHKEMKVLRPDDPEIVKLRILCQDRLRLCEEHTAKINELQAVVKGSCGPSCSGSSMAQDNSGHETYRKLLQ